MRQKTKFILLGTFVLVLCAGVMVGRMWATMPAASSPAGHGRSWLTDQLGLNPDQRQQMDAIWAQVRPAIQKTWETRRALADDRDAAIRKLLPSDQKTAYDKVLDEYHNRRTDLEKSIQQLIHDAEDKSRALLDADQQQKWDVLSKQMHSHHWSHGGWSTTAPASPQPTTQPEP